jgi:deoxyribose-phosphate aldolase
MKKEEFFIPKEEDVNKILERVKTKVAENKTDEVLKKILNLIDLTSLNGKDSEEDIIKMAEKVNDFKSKFPNYDNVAAICVYPSLVETVKKTLTDDNVKIAAVGGGFPASQTFLSIKVAECELCVSKGADEIDFVIPLGKFFSENFLEMKKEILIIKSTIENKHLKVILETGELKTIGNIAIASHYAIRSGADFIKTSTGKSDISATPEAVITMCLIIKDVFENTDSKSAYKIGIKPSGGIKTADDAILYYLIVKEILGEEWLNNKLFRFGASTLANNILSDLEKTNITYF